MVQIFFVSGAPKSGTTWLQKLLDAHPEIVCSGEGHFVEKLAAPLMNVRNEYNRHMQLVAERVYQGKPYYQPMGGRETLGLARSFILQLMGKRQTPETRALGDKTPRYTQFLPDLNVLFPEALFLNIVRDPRDVTVSRLHHARRAGYAAALDPASDDYRQLVKNAAEAWLAAQQKVDAFAQAHPSRLLEVRYEDLLERPEAEAAKAFLFLGVGHVPDVVTAAVTASSFEALSGRKRGEESGSSFFRKGVAGDWVDVLDAAALRTVRAICGDGMDRKGYADGRSREEHAPTEHSPMGGA
ncbi:Sulfotransferase family protein [Faunimonas pinastri]|uniref:Sulfotransferase family protein n=1 Tax=Faunimonas pinastri TaxID=1855383 RepID=A0A1H9FA54_9HYPH|nr:sulfotransferase [Faunimonas pinastri]SEQ34820.1 Sulfotransferase family protein [Faunimonas pinastri]